MKDHPTLPPLPMQPASARSIPAVSARPRDAEAGVSDAPSFRGKPCYNLSGWQMVAANLVLLGLHYFTSRWSLSFATIIDASTLIWIPAGLSLGCVLLFGIRLLPAVAAGAFIANVLHLPGLPWSHALLMATGNSLELILGWWLLRHVLDFDARMGRLHDCVSLLFVVAPIAPVVSSLLGALAICLAGREPWALYWHIASVWYVGNALGILVITPLIATWGHPRRLAAWRAAEAITVTLLVCATVGVAFSQRFNQHVGGYPLAFLPMPAIIWGAMRFGPLGASLLTFLFASVAVLATMSGRGPFDTTTFADGIKLLAAFIAVVAATALCLACSASESRRAQSRLHESRDRYRLLLDSSNVIAWDFDPVQRKFLYVSARAVDLLGFPLDRWYQTDFWMNAIHPEDRDAVAELCYREIGAGRDHTLEYRMVHADGRTVWFHDLVSVTPIPNRSPQVRGVLVDITERKQSQQRVYDAERKFRSLFEQSPYGVMLVDPVSQVLAEANPTMGDLLGGYRPDELTGIALSYFEVQEDAAAARRLFSRGSDVYETRFRRRDGAVIDVVVGVRMSTIGHRPILHCIVRDVTRQKQDALALRESEQRFRDMFERHKSVMLLVAADSGDIIDANLAAAEFYGYSPQELREAKISQLNKAESNTVTAAMNQAVTGERNYFEFVHTRRDGTQRTVEVYTSPLVRSGRTLLFSVIHDITERKQAEYERDRLQAQLIHTHKLESLAVMAGGVAHDFNNLLTSILGNTSLAKRAVPELSPLRSTLTTIEQSALRAADLTRQLLAYSGKGKLVAEQLDLSAMIVELVQILHVALPPTAEIKMEVAQNLPRVEVDATQVRQVAMNLLTNAADALEGNIGTIRISTGTLEATADFLAKTYVTTDAPPGTYVYLQIADTGKGMDRATLQRIFDPFFTTKFTGRGLGLAAALGILRGHKGAIKVESTPDVGTRFTVLFPLSASKASRQHQVSDSPAIEAHSASRTHEREGCDNLATAPLVLVVDDERLVREFAATTLSLHHCRVLQASSGVAAIAHVQEHNTDLAAILLDVTMPGMSGPELLWSLREMGISTPVILTSGYADDDALANALSLPNVTFIAKPYSPESLCAALDRVVNKYFAEVKPARLATSKKVAASEMYMGAPTDTPPPPTPRS